MEYVLNWWILAGIVIVIFVLILFWFGSKRKKAKPAEKIYIEGLKALVSGEDRIAFQEFRKVVDLDTNNIDAYLKLGDLFRKRKRVDRALQIHKQLLLRHNLTFESKKEIKKAIASDYIESKDYNQACAVLEDLLKSDEKDFWVLSKLLAEYEKKEDWEKAFHLREKFFKDKKEKSQKILALYKVFMGKKLASEKEFHKARISYKEALHKDVGCVPALIFLGDAYYEEKRVEEAISSWKKLLEIAPKSSYLVFEKLEKALFELGNYGEIEKIYDLVLRNDPQNIPALFALSILDEKRGRKSQAEQKHLQILDSDPDFLPSRLSLIKIYQDKGEKTKAKEMVDSLFDDFFTQSEKFFCERCGYSSAEPLWRCPSCKEWNSFGI